MTDLTIFNNVFIDSQPFIIANLYNLKKIERVIYVVDNGADIDLILEILNFFSNVQVIVFSEWDSLPYKKSSPSNAIMAKRIETLNLISTKGKEPYIVLTTVNAIMQKVLPREIVQNAKLELRLNQNIKRDYILKYLVDHGYTQSYITNDPGEFSIRGSLIDVFSATKKIPIRIDFHDNVIESIKEFDVDTQVTKGNILDSCIIYSASEIIKRSEFIKNFNNNYHIESSGNQLLLEHVNSQQKYIGEENCLPLFYNHLSTLFDYIEEPTLILQDSIFDNIKKYDQQINLSFNNSSQELKQILPSRLYLTEIFFLDAVDRNEKIIFSKFDCLKSEFRKRNIETIKIEQIPNFHLLAREKKVNIIRSVIDYLQNLRVKNINLIIACYSIGSLEHFTKAFQEYNINLSIVTKYQDINYLHNIVILPISRGFLTESFLLITEQDLFGGKLVISSRGKNNIAHIISDNMDLNTGDLIVHKEYGIGRFIGLETLKVFESQHDFIKLIYQNNDKLFLPVENMNLITKYGSDSDNIDLDRLGSTAWQERKAKLKNRIKDIAAELLELEAKRQAISGKIFDKNIDYHNFCKDFPYVETEDQINAIADVENDLTSGRIMDRLICGDVGFGKTEVALRAAFLAVSNTNDINQVAIIVPTTLLARQHYAVFNERFKNFSDIKIRHLSRIVNNKEAKLVKDDLEKGEINIIIGTHALLSQNIKFFNLNLIIIDEEQHFGVKQKEILKKMKIDVHVLSLSATPIPRTLHMSLSGVKDLSLIKTPPVDRLPIKSYVIDYDKEVIRDAIIRENNRGGRVFYVCPFISDMEEIHKNLISLVPEIRVNTAHGKISPAKLDEIMNDFFDGKFTVLLTTSIIECGIDLPFANTIIIHNADMFGLAQLYQLKGRVGRSKVRGYSYFIISKKNLYNKTSIKRLEAIKSMDQIGSGFSISLHDMDIRGFGNLVGEEQSGHIKEVGIELYQKMLEEEINHYKKSDYIETDLNIKININLDIKIPDDYIDDVNLKLKLYKRSVALRNKNEINNFSIELTNRFGKIPEEVTNLLDIIYIKQLCAKIDVYEVNVMKNNINLKVKEGAVFSQELLNYILSNPLLFRLKDKNNILILLNTNDPKKAKDLLIFYLHNMCNLNVGTNV